MQILIRRHILACLIWVCTVCQCPDITVGINGLVSVDVSNMLNEWNTWKQHLDSVNLDQSIYT